MRVHALIQARMGSRRLPEKILKPIQGKPMLERVIERVGRAKEVSDIAVITSDNTEDDAVVSLCRAKGVLSFRGSEEDVLDRFYQAAKEFQAEIIVRITADCPLIDPGVLDDLIVHFSEKKPDYASNFLKRTFPRGLDSEIMTFECLEAAWKEAVLPYHRAHATPYIYETPGRFRLSGLTALEDYSGYRLTVDTPEDLNFIQAIYGRFHEPDFVSWRQVIDLLKKEPALLAINASIRQKQIHEG